jgi:hypothetical protein
MKNPVNSAGYELINFYEWVLFGFWIYMLHVYIWKIFSYHIMSVCGNQFIFNKIQGDN